MFEINDCDVFVITTNYKKVVILIRCISYKQEEDLI